MSAPDPAGDSLLVVIDPAARRADGESVRIAKDVLCAGARAKICLPDGPEDVRRALARLGSRRPVVVGDDRALLHAVALLHQQRELGGLPLSVVPVGGSPAAVSLAGSLGVPTGAVDAARAVLDGVEHRRDLLLDDRGGVVLGAVRIPPGPLGPFDLPYQDAGGGAEGSGGEGHGAHGGETGEVDGGHRSWWGPAARTARTALSLLARPVSGLAGGVGGAEGNGAGAPGGSGGVGGPGGVGGTGGVGGPARRRGRPPAQRLCVEADGVLLVDLDRPVDLVSVYTTHGGFPALPGSGCPGTPGAPPVIPAPTPAPDRATRDPAAPGGAAAGALASSGGPAGDGGLAEVVVCPREASDPVRARARAVTVSGPDFHYRADALVGGPVRTRTWTVQAGAWCLMLPRRRPGSSAG